MSKSKTTLIHFFEYCTLNKLPFTFYRLPGQKSISVIAQKSSGLGIEPKSRDRGFVFVPFAEDEIFKSVFIRAEIFAERDKLPSLNFAGEKGTFQIKKATFKYRKTGKLKFKEHVIKIRDNIRKGKFTKIVAARVVLKKKPAHFEPATFFESLCKKYPQAFISLVYTAQYGLWIGATPELLLKVDKQGFKTYSLAGTKANNKINLKNAWGEKEKEEQRLVSDFVLQAFKKVTTAQPKTEGPITISAGNLLHLRTTFFYKGLAPSLWTKVVKQLHPTPAVAGLPQKKAVDFICTFEHSPRAFYSGYLGPVNIDKSVELFVNLRCMQVLKNKLALHVGCGITKDSKPDAEWQESKIKTETLLNAL